MHPEPFIPKSLPAKLLYGLSRMVGWLGDKLLDYATARQRKIDRRNFHGNP